MAELSLDEVELLTKAVCAGELRQAARLITRIENGDEAIRPVLQSLYLQGGKAQLLGITGPPGAGKSTLVNRMVSAYRKQGLTVAVLAVDPSSPFSGGAILGDRVRMSEHDLDAGVFIRSMASRGQLGGLAKAAGDVITVLDAMGWDVVIVETVGIGQSEIDIVRHSDTVLLLQTAGLGDDVQAIKAGIMEIADIFVVNKADQGDVDKTVSTLNSLCVRHAADNSWQQKVIKTQATSGEGINELLGFVADHLHFLAKNPVIAAEQRKQRIRHRVLEICYNQTYQQIFSLKAESIFEHKLDDVAARNIDPYEVACQIIPSTASM